uniref:Receptor ligand binding region domain-containing protein n=1 Tax=Parascaris univalens TaxID=6257 RepID=A0A915BV17_PARUN
MKHYNWTEFALIYALTVAGTGNCYFLQEDLVQALRLFHDFISLVYTRAVPIGISDFTDVLDELRSRARIVVICFEKNSQKRRFMEAAKAKGMSNPEYVYIFPDVDNTGFGIGNYGNQTDSSYVNDGSEDMLEVFQYALAASRYAGSLYDTMYMYGLALNKSLNDDPINGWRRGSQILSYATGTFNGSIGPVIIDKNGIRSPVYSMDAMNISGAMSTFATVKVEGHNYQYWGYVFAAGALLAVATIALIISAVYMVGKEDFLLERDVLLKKRSVDE